MRIADYIINYLYDHGIDTIFMVVGGGAMFLNDAILQHGKMKYVCCHHEQAAAMAASGYARYTNKIGAVCVTTGCGGTNAITGVLGAYQDNIPMIIISGQTKRKETIQNSGLKLRQLGVQEADIITIITSITKYATTINNKNEVPYHLDKAFYLATHGSPGPVWIDVPLDIQSSQVNDEFFSGQKFEEVISKEIPTNKLAQCLMMFQVANRPIVIAGHGIYLANAVSEFKNFIEDNQLPVVFSRLGIDILPTDYPLNIGRLGTKGDRAGNFAVQNADLILSIGSRLSVSTTGQEYDLFARETKKIVVDINPIEHQKKTIPIDLFIEMDAKQFLEMMKYVGVFTSQKEWIQKCQSWKKKWPVYNPEYAKSERINLYYFLEVLSQKLKPNSIVVADAGSAMFATAQGIKLKEGDRLILSGGQAEMGFTIPASVGVSFAKDKGEVIGIVGDGSFQMNIQELQTIKHHNLPIKLFVWNNGGYLTIHNTQQNFFKRQIGNNPESGISFPSLQKIANAYEIKYFLAPDSFSLPDVIDMILEYDGPTICEVLCLTKQEIIPAISTLQLPDGKLASMPPEDMYPFLPREEFFKEMIIKPSEASYKIA